MRSPRFKWMIPIALAVAAGLALSWRTGRIAPRSGAASELIEPERWKVTVLEVRPHDPEAYTQGLVWSAGKLFESTGHYGRSTLRRVDPDSGEVEARVSLPDRLFGEGLAKIGERLIQLTWREGVALVWRWPDLEQVGSFDYQGEGWGLCFDGRRLVMSDGSASLSFRDPDSFELLRQVEVTHRGRPVAGLNELECAEGWVYANVYATDWIARIDPASGRVTALIDASGLLSPEEAVGVDVLNGIAFDPDRDLFYLTGKNWPKLFLVRFTATESRPEP